MTELIITSSVLILMVIVLRHFLKGKIGLRLQYALWALVLIRLLVPVTLFESPISVMNAVQAAKLAREVSVASTPTPALSSAYGDMGAENAAVPGVTEQNVSGSITNVTHHVFRWGLMAQWVWYIGIGIVGLTLLLSNFSFDRKLRKTRKVYEADDCKLPVYTVDILPSPCLFGFFRPSIYITTEVAGDTTKLRHVLAHELTHYRHGDHIWAALRCLSLAVHWYNPIVWLSAALSRRDSELACDEGTIKRIGEASRMEYGRTLIGLTCEKRKAVDLLCCATTMTDGKSGIKERIVLIAKKPRVLVPAVIAVVLVAAVAVGCTFTGAMNEAEIVPLTAEELEQYNKAFEPLLFDGQGNPISVDPISQFFASYYSRPEDVNLAELLRYYPSDGDVTDEAEFEALKAAENWPFGPDVTLDGMPVPIHKFSAGTVNKALKEYMGITLDDLSGVGLDELIYLKAYDAYYNFTSDAGYGSFVCTSGEKQGDIVRLFGETAILTLKMQGDGFLIVSHQCTGDASDKSGGESSALSVKVESEGNSPQAAIDYATEYVAQQVDYYNEAGKDISSGMGTYAITDAKVTGLTQINTGTAGLNSGVNLYLLEYRLRPDHPENVALAGGMQMEEIAGEKWLTEWGSTGQPYLLLAWDDGETETSWQRVCVTNTDVIKVDYGTPEMLKRYGDAFTAAAMELYQKNLDIGQLPESSVLLASLPDEQIFIYGDKNDNDINGEYDGLYLSINGVNRDYAWKNIGKDSFLPELNLTDLNGDGQKELLVILTTGEGTGADQKAVHVINPEDFVETGVTDPLDIISKNIDTSIVHENGSVTVTVTVNGKKSVITLPENYTQRWAEDKASFGSIVTYEVDGAELKATVLAQISYTLFIGEAVITYTFDGSQYVMKTIEYVPYAL